MKALKAYFEGKNLYVLFLHVAVIALAVEVVVLARQNNELKSPTTATTEQLAVGDLVTINDLKAVDGNQNLVLNSSRQILFFFTTTCPFCKINIGNWEKISMVAKENGIQVIGVCLDSLNKANLYVKEQRISFPVYVPILLEFYSKQNKISSVPKTVLRDSTGNAKKIWAGLLKNDDLEAILQIASNKQQFTTNK